MGCKQHIDTSSTLRAANWHQHVRCHSHTVTVQLPNTLCSFPECNKSLGACAQSPLYPGLETVTAMTEAGGYGTAGGSDQVCVTHMLKLRKSYTLLLYTIIYILVISQFHNKTANHDCQLYTIHISHHNIAQSNHII